jgi:hypothetical protein
VPEQSRHSLIGQEINALATKESIMTWTLTNLLIELIAGVVGGLCISAALHEHSFGALGHTVTGAIGGAVSGYFFQTIVATVVDSTGAVEPSDRVTVWMLQALAGLAAGAIATMAVGFAKHSSDRHRLAKRQLL